MLRELQAKRVRSLACCRQGKAGAVPFADGDARLNGGDDEAIVDDAERRLSRCIRYCRCRRRMISVAPDEGGVVRYVIPDLRCCGIIGVSGIHDRGVSVKVDLNQLRRSLCRPDCFSDDKGDRLAQINGFSGG